MELRARLNWLHFSVFRKWVIKDVSGFCPCQKQAMQYLDSNSTCHRHPMALNTEQRGCASSV